MAYYGRAQSDIAKVRDQLSIDYADGEYLNVVTANLGIDRPVFGFSDAVWRAAVKAIALRYKQVRSAFEEVIEVILGPEYTQTAILAEDVEAGDTYLEMLDASRLPQCGTLILDAGQISEESLDYVFVDYATNLVYLSSEAVSAHTADAADSSDLEPVTFLTVDASAGALSLTVSDSDLFPTTNYPYTILIGQGTDQEESLVVTNNTGTVLSLQDATTKDHYAPRPTVIKTTTVQAYGAEAFFLTCDDTLQFPPTGHVLINGETPASSSIVEYTSNNYEEGVLNLKDTLSMAFAAGTSVELLSVTDTVELAQVQVHGCGWHLYQTTPRKVELYVPEHCKDIGNLFSASYLHDEAQAAASTTLTVAAAPDDEYIDVTASAGFPHHGTITISPGADEVRRAYYKHDSVANRLVIPHTVPDGITHPIGATVELYQPVLTGTLLSGDLFSTEDVWAGPYVYDPGADGPSAVDTTLTMNLAGPTRVMLGIEEVSGLVTALEVEDASLFPTSFPYDVRVGARTGNREDVEVTDVSLRVLTATTVNGAGSSIGATTLPCAATITDFPSARGYRIRIARGTADEEIAYVLSRSGTEFTLESPLTVAHAAGQAVELVSDVLTVTSLSDYHEGYFQYSQRSETHPTLAGHEERLAETVYPLYDSFTVTDGSSFPLENENLVLNFGSSLLSERQRLSSAVAAGATTLSFTSTAGFPSTTTHALYYVTLGAGTYNQEVVEVTLNDTGLNQLTIVACKYAHAADEWVEFHAPEPEVLEFTDRATNTFRFSPAIVLNSNHLSGETVTASQESAPDNTGTDFPLRMPPDVVARLRFMFDLVRAAGVEVVFLTTR